MVAEAKEEAPTERIIKYFLQQEHNTSIYYGYDRTAGKSQVVIHHVSGTDEDCTIQHDIWAGDKETALTKLVDIVGLYRAVASYQTPYGTLVGANPINYIWRPDDEYARYILDVRISTIV